MSGVLPLGPHQKDDPSTLHRQALQSQFTVELAIIFYRDHWEVEGALKPSEINAMLLEIELLLGLIPGDH